MDNISPSDEIEVLRLLCDQKRRALRDAVQQGGDKEAAAKVFAAAFNAYQESRAQVAKITVKRISAFHVLKNLDQILSTIKD